MERSSSWVSPEEIRSALQEGDGAGVRVAILDSGIDRSHPQLDGLPFAEAKTVVEGERGPEVVDDEQGDVFGHGTAVAYLVHEIAPKAEIGSFKVLQLTENRCSGTAAVLETAVKAAIDGGYHIVNCSFGTPARPAVFRYFKSWIDQAYLHDVHIVTACNNANYTRPEWPAFFPSVIAVNMGRIDGSEFYYRPGQLVEFFARGEKVEVPWLDGSVRKVTGSSYAAPTMTGLLARLLSVHPGLSVPLAKAALRHIALPWTEAIAGDNVWL